MDLGCLDMGCISVSDKRSNETFTDSSNKEGDPNDPVSANSRVGKSKSPKGNNQPTWNALNKCTAQIKKPRHRNSSPLNWFPRKKVDSYLKRKIKKLQEVDGMNLTLDETLGDTNPHYSRVLREKMAAREAAHTAMEARKAALVEASWCRILKAARIQSKEAEALLLKSEKAAAEAFEAATAMGVIMYDKPNCPQMHYQIETSYVNGGGSTTHTITASFDTAFEVDKEVAAAVKTAFVRLANYPPFNKEEFKDLLHKISENPDTGDSYQELSEFSSECESDSGSELEIVLEENGFGSQDLEAKESVLGMRQSKSKRRQSLEKVSRASLVEMMLERLKWLQEDELSSLATIVATCGLNAALAEVEISKMHNPSSVTDFPSSSVPNYRRVSSMGAGLMRNANLYLMNGSVRRKQIESELPSLDKVLVKHMSKLEREVQEAKNSRMNESKELTGKNPGEIEDGEVKVDSETVHQSETTSDLGSHLLKHSSKFAKEIEEAKKSGNNFKIDSEKSSEAGGVPSEEVTQRKEDGEIKVASETVHQSETTSDLGSHLKHYSKFAKEIEEAKKSGDNFKIVAKNSEAGGVPSGEVTQRKKDVPEIPSLDKVLVKHMSKLEREVQEAKNARMNESKEISGKNPGETEDGEVKVDSETVHQSETTSDLGSHLLKHSSTFAKEIEAAKKSGNNFKIDSEKNSEAGGVPSEEITQRKKEGEIKVASETVHQSETTSGLGSHLLKHYSEFAKEIEEAKKSGNNFKIVGKNSEAGGFPSGEVTQRKKDVPEIPSLEKFLVKRVSRLEREVQEAKSRRNNDSFEEAKKKADVPEVPSLDKFLVKHVSKLEKEVQEAKSRRNNELVEGSRVTDLKKNTESQSEKFAISSLHGVEEEGKENIDLNKEDARFSGIEDRDMKARTEETVGSLDKILVKPVHRLEREKMQANSAGNNYRNYRPQKYQGWNNDTECDGLDKVLVKHVSRLEKEKMKFNASEQAVKVKRNGISMHSQMKEGDSLDQVLVKHKPRLEREKMMMAAAAQQPAEEIHIRHTVSRREARERELQEAWGGLSLGNSIKPHLSKLERDKAAWIKAEEEERMQGVVTSVNH